MDEVFFVSVEKDTKLTKSGLFHCKLEEIPEFSQKLINLVTKGAIEDKGIGKIEIPNEVTCSLNLLYQCNEHGTKVSGTWGSQQLPKNLHKLGK